MPSPWNSSPSPRRSDWTSLAKERSAMLQPPPHRDERGPAPRAAGAVDDLQRRGDDDRPGRRQLVEIGQARQPETVRAVHDGVAGKHGIETMRLAGGGPGGLHTDTENVAFLCQERHALRMKPRGVRAARTHVEKLRPCPMRPVGADENPGMRGNAAVLALPLPPDLPRQEEIRIRFRLRGHIDDAGGPNEALDRDVVSCVVRIVLAGHPMNGRIEMRAGMLTARDVVPIPGGPALVVAGNLLQRKRLGGRKRRRKLDRRRRGFQRHGEIHYAYASGDDCAGELNESLGARGTGGLRLGGGLSGCAHRDSPAKY